MADPAMAALALSVQWTTAVVFAVAAASKVVPAAQFARVLREHKVLPEEWVLPASVLVPVIEVAIAAGLLLPGNRSVAAVAAALVLLGFAVLLGANLLRGRANIDCGCSPGSRQVGIAPWMVIRNVLLAAALVASACVAEDSSFDGLTTVSVAAAVTVMSIFYHALPELLLKQRELWV